MGVVGMTEFEKKVLAGLAQCGIVVADVTELCPLGVAVSGGADSVSLLCALYAIFGGKRLRVLTVNHNIRSEEESAGDAQFVRDVCENLSVSCKCVVFARGDVASSAKERGHGIEEAARFLRYKAFDDFIAEENLFALCLAHNQNDMMETLLMRFLQGSGAEGGSGIAWRREKMVRPLLEISRAEIENYLHQRGQDWRTDSSNADTNYLRNNVRKNLVPFLDAHFIGWKKALATGAEKTSDDNDALQTLSDVLCWQKQGNDLVLDAESFFWQPKAVRRRVLFNALNLLGGAERFPYTVVRQVLEWKKSDFSSCDAKKNPSLRRKISARGIEILCKSGKISVKKCEKMATESGFLDIIEEDGSSVRLVRSVQSGDVVRTKDGSFKSVQKIFGDWKVRAEDRNQIPLVQDLSQEGQPIVAIMGSELGYSDWIVT